MLDSSTFHVKLSQRDPNQKVAFLRACSQRVVNWTAHGATTRSICIMPVQCFFAMSDSCVTIGNSALFATSASEYKTLFSQSPIQHAETFFAIIQPVQPFCAIVHLTPGGDLCCSYPIQNQNATLMFLQAQIKHCLP